MQRARSAYRRLQRADAALAGLAAGRDGPPALQRREAALCLELSRCRRGRYHVLQNWTSQCRAKSSVVGGMAVRWPDAASNVLSPRPAAPRMTSEVGHRSHAAGLFQSDTGAQIGTHRVGVHTEPHSCQAPMANHLHKDGIWPAVRGPQDQRAPGYDPAGLSAFGTALEPRPYRDRYMYDDYRLLPFAPRLNAATATRSDHAARARPAEADGARARDRHLARPDQLSSPHASTVREPAAARALLPGSAFYPASSLAPTSERLRAALESSLTDAADERAGYSWVSDGVDGPRSSFVSRGCGGTAGARAAWDASPRSARDSLASCASARGAVDASLAAARAVYNRGRGSPLRTTPSFALAHDCSRRGGLDGGVEVDARVSRASQLFTSTLGDGSPQPDARATRRSPGGAYPHESAAGGVSPSPRRVAWVDMAAPHSRAWPIFATEPSMYAGDDHDEVDGDSGGKDSGWGLGAEYGGKTAALPVHTVRAAASQGLGSYCGPTNELLFGASEIEDSAGADVQIVGGGGFVPHLERKLSASHGYAMAALRSRQRQALSRLAPAATRPAAAAAKASSQSAHAAAAAARVTAAARELAEAVAEAGYWGKAESAASAAASMTAIGAANAPAEAQPNVCEATAPDASGLEAGMRWASLDATLSASLSLSSTVDAAPPCTPATPATTVSAAAAAVADAARALAAPDAQAIRQRPRLWVPPSPLCCGPRGGETDGAGAGDVTSATAPRRATFDVDAAPAAVLPTVCTLPTPVTAPSGEGDFSATATSRARPALVRAQSEVSHQELLKHRLLPRDMTKPPSGAAPLARGLSADCPAGNKSPYKRGCREAAQVTPVNRSGSDESSSSGGAGGGGGGGSPDWRSPWSPYKRGTRAATPIAPRSTTPSIEAMARSMATESELLQSLRKLHRQFEDSLTDLRLGPPAASPAAPPNGRSSLDASTPSPTWCPATPA